MIWFKFNNNRSDEKGIVLKEIPMRYYPEKRINRIQIPNRDGYLYEEEEAYDTVILPLELTIKNRDEINSVFSWLNGEGELSFSDYPDRFYKARIINTPTFQKLLSTFGTCQIQFECMPFSNKPNEQTITTDSELTIETLVPTRPILELTGTGNFDIIINNKTIHLLNVTNPVIDCNLGILIENDMPVNTKINGDARELKLNNGTNTVEIIGTYTSLKIKYNERWL